jgi:hypothetical protein
MFCSISSRRSVLFEELGVDVDVFFPFLRGLFVFEDGLDGTFGFARAAAYALFRVDIELDLFPVLLFQRILATFIERIPNIIEWLRAVDAIDGTDIHA